MATNGRAGQLKKPHDLTDLTFQRIHGALAHHESMDVEPLQAALEHRAPLLRRCIDGFPKPSTASRTLVTSGIVTLRDGTSLQVEEEDKEIVWEISGHLDLDEVEALTLLRLFIFNEGLSKSQASTPALLLDALTEFYFEERLFAIRILGAMLRGKDNAADPYHELCTQIVSENLPRSQDFAREILKALVDRPIRSFPPSVTKDPRTTARWAKQNLKEQLCMLETFFWSTVAYSPDGGLVAGFFKAAGETNLGRVQKYEDLLLDEECSRLINDLMVLFGITGVQLLKLDKVLDEVLDLELATKQRYGYLASVEDVEQIHNIVANLPEDHSFSPMTLAWGCVVAKISRVAADDVPTEYQRFYALLNPPPPRKGRATFVEPQLSLGDSLVNRSLGLGVLPVLQSYLQSPIFSTSLAASLASTVTEPNNEQFRYIIKCLLMSLIDLVQVEYIEDYEGIVSVWTGIYGTGEMPVVASLCSEFWMRDVTTSVQRRSLLDLASSRFPVEVSPLLRLLRSVSGVGGLAELDSLEDEGDRAANRLLSAERVYQYFSQLQTFTQVLSPHHLHGAQALYDTRPDASLGYYYTNSRALRFPGGSILPVGSRGRVISTQGVIVVSWKHQHSGWDFILGVLEAIHSRQSAQTGTTRASRHLPRGMAKVTDLELEDIGMQTENEEELVADILDLLRSLLQRNLELAGEFVSRFKSRSDEEGLPVTGSDSPDLVQIILLILKDALLSSASSRGAPPTRVVAGALGVLTALLPVVPAAIWPFLRSLPQLFGDERQAGLTPHLLDAERAAGTYSMTLALLDLVGALFDEAFRMVLTHNRTLQSMKADVLLRALHFVHSEIWIEHISWKYAKVTERFEIGRKIGIIYAEVLKLSPPLAPQSRESVKAGPAVMSSTSTLGLLTQFILDTFLFKATTLTITPLISTITTSLDVYEALQRSLRYLDADGLVQLVDANLHLTQLVLSRKRASGVVRLTLLEQALFTGVSTTSQAFSARVLKLEPVDIIASLVKTRTFGPGIALEAIQLLCALCSSVSMTQPAPPAIVGHLVDPEGVAAAYVGSLADPYEDLDLRKAIWNFITIAVDTQPAFASLFVSGQLHSAGPETGRREGGRGRILTALEFARQTLANPALWDVTPSLHASALGMLDLVWQHALEHKQALTEVREDKQFWQDIASIAWRELGAPPDSVPGDFFDDDDEVRVGRNDAVSQWAYHATSKAHALHVLAIDLKISSPDGQSSSIPPASCIELLKVFQASQQLRKHVNEALYCSYDPHLHDQLQQSISTYFPAFTLDSVRSEPLPGQRSYGDHYMYQADVVHNWLMKSAKNNQEIARQATGIYTATCAANLNWSLTDSQIILLRSWKQLLQQSASWLKSTKGLEASVIDSAASTAKIVAGERRSGNVMRAVHAERLDMLQGLVNVAWQAPAGQIIDTTNFLPLLKSVRLLSLNEVFPPIESLRRYHSNFFHRPLLCIVYYCAQRAAEISASSHVGLDQRLTISTDISEISALVIDGLRYVFESMISSTAVVMDEDLQMLVAVFDKCTEPRIHSTPSAWLTRCQDVDLIRASLDLLARSNVSGLDADGSYDTKRAMSAQFILQFHIILARLPASTERLAHEGALAAYAKTNLTSLLEAGAVEPTSPSHNAEYSLGHRAWCNMLGVTTAMVNVLGGEGHFVDTEIVGFVQMCGAQLTKVLGWTSDAPMTLSHLDEIGLVIGLFHAVAAQSVEASQPDPAVADILRAFSERALLLLQQLNYALTHPNHLSTLLEPVTLEERTQMEKEDNALSIETTIQLLDERAYPVLASLVQKLLIIVRDIMSVLVIMSKADQALCYSDPLQWARHLAQVPADSKVSATGPASVGTLRDLAGFMLEVLRKLAKAGPTTSHPSPNLRSSLLASYDAQETQMTTFQAVEQSFLYAYTQLAATVHQPPVASPLTGRTDEQAMDIEREGIFSQSLAPGTMDRLRLMRQWKDLAVDLNLLAKDVPYKTGAGATAKLFFDEIQKSTYTLVQTLDRRMKGQ
ncbi:hypothetical protein FRB96_000010 [Tulasnella sp. 330]|nr:hypothetical protein FRB96_000010 [Tulasnella sp. 330]KAG8890480.1 hypothetical protein FRB98_007827 [Tulasnella sp. 332]